MRLRCGLLAAVSVAGTAGDAGAYVRMRTQPGGPPLEWGRACPMMIVGSGAADPFPSDVLQAELEAALAAWNQDACHGLPAGVLGLDSDAQSGVDGRNSVLWRTAGYCCLDGAGLGCEQPNPEHLTSELCLAPQAAAVTVIYYRTSTGEIVETDVEINAEVHPFGVGGEVDRFDLRSVLAHELGHVLGLEHTCETIPGATPLTDDRGELVGYCSPEFLLPPEVVATTMYPYTAAGETLRRDPEPDERAALCAIYGARDGSCEALGPCSCRAGAAGAGAGALTALLLLGPLPLVALLRTRRRRS